MIGKLQNLKRTLDAILGHCISFSIICFYPFLILSLTFLGILDCKVIEYNKFSLHSKIIAYFCSLMFCYGIGTFSAAGQRQLQSTSCSKERIHKGETN